MNTLRTEAEKLRDHGYSYNMIHEELGIPVSTMSYWFRDRPFKPNKQVVQRVKYGPIKSGARAHNKKVREIRKLRKIGVAEVGKLTKRDLWMLGVGLYIGEGSKTIESIRIINSDPSVIAVGVRWLKEICGLSNENLTIRLHIYPDIDEAEAKQYWREVTGLPLRNFRKTTVDARKDKKNINHRKLPYGTAHVIVVSRGDADKGVKLFRRINGWIYGTLNQV